MYIIVLYKFLVKECSKIGGSGPLAYLVEHRIRIAERAVRNRHGPPHS